MGDDFFGCDIDLDDLDEVLEYKEEEGVAVDEEARHDGQGEVRRVNSSARQRLACKDRQRWPSTAGRGPKPTAVDGRSNQAPQLLPKGAGSHVRLCHRPEVCAVRSFLPLSSC